MSLYRQAETDLSQNPEHWVRIIPIGGKETFRNELNGLEVRFRDTWEVIDGKEKEQIGESEITQFVRLFNKCLFIHNKVTLYW